MRLNLQKASLKSEYCSSSWAYWFRGSWLTVKEEGKEDRVLRGLLKWKISWLMVPGVAVLNSYLAINRSLLKR